MKERIQNVDWMSDTTKQKALEKLSKFTVKIGYPDKWKDYSKLEIKNDSYVQNGIRAAHFEFQRDLAKIGKPVDKTAIRGSVLYLVQFSGALLRGRPAPGSPGSYSSATSRSASTTVAPRAASSLATVDLPLASPPVRPTRTLLAARKGEGTGGGARP